MNWTGYDDCMLTMGEPGECCHGVPDDINCPECENESLKMDVEILERDAEYYFDKASRLSAVADALATEAEDSRSTASCGFCGYKFDRRGMSQEQVAKQAADHILNCENHPIHKSLERCKTLFADALAMAFHLVEEDPEAMEPLTREVVEAWRPVVAEALAVDAVEGL